MAGHNSQSKSYGPLDHLQLTFTHSLCLLGARTLKKTEKPPLQTLALERPVVLHLPSIDSKTKTNLTKRPESEWRGTSNDSSYLQTQTDYYVYVSCFRLRRKAKEDHSLNEAQVNMNRAHNATYRAKKELQVKAMLRLDDLHWRKYGRPSPAAEKRDFPEELQWFQEEGWSERMPAHLRARRQQSGEML
ncbi:hypothetical protein C8F04DRAFT_1199858 [Mycena alexandri]|uniref:Uncharacterized protein n=1 Tax=Mycena alexandri TaxID=1745969 RepID=A0AAD6RYR4_9AGAR|nr:hypothetical protein C8F04DRAFT_1199858 [Mycena alexandri]